MRRGARRILSLVLCTFLVTGVFVLCVKEQFEKAASQRELSQQEEVFYYPEISVTATVYYSAKESSAAVAETKKEKTAKKKRISVKDFGAVGDGIQNDYPAFAAAMEAGISELYIPNGTYELGGNIVSTNGNISFVGESQAGCIIKNGCISSRSGIRVSNITFDGGAVQTINYTGRVAEQGTIILDVTPIGQQSVSCKNCTFRNATVASFATEQAGSFSTDEAIGCTFTNLRRMGIYHSVNVGSGTYRNNVFAGFGGGDLLRGYVAALCVGDISNNTYVQANSIVIEGNTFSDMITQSDFSDASHIISANFIAIKSDKAVINKNTISNLIGYGNDREAVYTKVRNLTVSNNKITEGGFGEAYICNKSQDGDAFCNIYGNTLTGNAGCGIRSYGPGVISDNTITIANCTTAITCTRREGITNARELIIRGNKINCGTYPILNISGMSIGTYSTGKAVRVSGVTVPVIIEKNSFNPTTAFEQYIAVGNPGVSISVCDNIFNAADKGGIGVSIFGNKNGGSLSQNCQVLVDRNQFYMAPSAKVTRINFDQDPSMASSRNITFSGNIVRYSHATGEEAVIACYSGNANKDNLVINGNDCNLVLFQTFAMHSVSSVTADRTDYVILKK